MSGTNSTAGGGVARTVTITSAGGIQLTATVRAVGQPAPGGGQTGPSWTLTLATGTYLFNVDILAVAGTSVGFTFAGATALPPTSFPMPGMGGVVVGVNREIEFSVA